MILRSDNWVGRWEDEIDREGIREMMGRGNPRFPLIVWWKCAAVEGGVFRFLLAEDIPPEQFAPLAVT